MISFAVITICSCWSCAGAVVKLILSLMLLWLLQGPVVVVMMMTIVMTMAEITYTNGDGDGYDLDVFCNVSSCVYRRVCTYQNRHVFKRRD